MKQINNLLIVLFAIFWLPALALNKTSKSSTPTLKTIDTSQETVEEDLAGILKDSGPRTRRGHVLFFFPVITKSAKITFMPVAEKMAERGHQVGGI